MAGNEKNNPNVRIIYAKLEDYVERCKKRAVSTIYFTVRETAREDKRFMATIELTAMDYSQEATNLIFTEVKISEDLILSQEAYEAFRKELNLRLMGGDVELMQNGKKEIVRVPGIIPFIQGEYSGAEIKNGWIGW
jgi:hypothetical protein